MEGVVCERGGGLIGIQYIEGGSGVNGAYQVKDGREIEEGYLGAGGGGLGVEEKLPWAGRRDYV